MFIKKGLKILKDGDAVLVISVNSQLEKLFIESHSRGVRFTVYALGDESENFKDMAVNLQKAGIQVIYSTLASISHFIKSIDKVFITPYTIFCNGNAQVSTGTLPVAMLAKKYKKTVYLISGVLKFSEKAQIDSFAINECTEESQTNTKLKLYKTKYELLQNKYISLMITELGLLPTTCITSVLKDFENDLQKIVYSEI